MTEEPGHREWRRPSRCARWRSRTLCCHGGDFSLTFFSVSSSWTSAVKRCHRIRGHCAATVETSVWPSSLSPHLGPLLWNDATVSVDVALPRWRRQSDFLCLLILDFHCETMPPYPRKVRCHRRDWRLFSVSTPVDFRCEKWHRIHGNCVGDWGLTLFSVFTRGFWLWKEAPYSWRLRWRQKFGFVLCLYPCTSTVKRRDRIYGNCTATVESELWRCCLSLLVDIHCEKKQQFPRKPLPLWRLTFIYLFIFLVSTYGLPLLKEATVVAKTAFSPCTVKNEVWLCFLSPFVDFHSEKKQPWIPPAPTPRKEVAVSAETALLPWRLQSNACQHHGLSLWMEKEANIFKNIVLL